MTNQITTREINTALFKARVDRRVLLARLKIADALGQSQRAFEIELRLDSIEDFIEQFDRQDESWD